MNNKQQKRLEVLETVDTSEMTLEEMHDVFNERSELLLLRNKENINFILKGKGKDYYAFQCWNFTKTLEQTGYGRISPNEIKEDGISFNKYSITLGNTKYGEALKRFNGKEEMLGFVIGYNECIYKNRIN
tara:strand:+ start:1172 stop:1561 length:390 start_codon:yes stop_codon:yes gene_type:complete